MSTMPILWAMSLLGGALGNAVFQDDDGCVVTAASEVAIEDSGDEAWIPREQAGIASEIPVGPHTVAVQHQHRLRLPRLREFPRLVIFLSDDAVMRDEMPPFIPGDHDGGDIADACKADDPRRMVEHCNSECCPSGGLCGLMRGFQQFDRRKTQGGAAYCLDDRGGGIRGDQSVTKPVRHRADPSVRKPTRDPVVAADGFAGFGLT